MPFSQEGPALESLQHRLAEIPAELFAQPDAGALLHDTLRMLGIPILGEHLSQWRNRALLENHGLLPLFCWLLIAPELIRTNPPGPSVWRLLTETSPQLAAQAGVRPFLDDPDRREELLRLALAELDMRPAGETPEQAQDRLGSISSLERARVFEAARAAEARAREIREALLKRKAREGADKWARE